MKPGESRVSEGPKNERTELNEKLESQTEQSAEAVGSGNCGHYPKGKALARRCGDRKSTRLNSSHQIISYAVFCLKKKKSSTNDYLIVYANYMLPTERSVPASL